MKIVPVYAALLSFLFIYLSFRVIKLRRSLRIGIGHSDSEIMVRAMRVHANFAEYAPIGLLLLFFVEMQNAHYAVVHILCIILVVGRFLHAYGVSQEDEKFNFRIAGMVMTFSAIGGAALYLLGSALL